MSAPEEIPYRPRGRYRSNRLGAHSSTEVGGFGVFRDQASFLRHPDSRRIDLRASLRDPFEHIYVRRFEQRQSVDVFAIVDLSASMTTLAACDKLSNARKICQSLAYSATKIGDRFGLIGCAEAIGDDSLLVPTRSRSVALTAVARLRHEAAIGKSAEGFLKAAEALGSSRKLVCLISDFRWPQTLVRRVLDVFSLHDAIPMVLLDSAEENPPTWGLLELFDAESGRRRLFAMRPRLRARWIAQEKERQQLLKRLAANRCRPPIFVRDPVDPNVLSQQLMAA